MGEAEKGEGGRIHGDGRLDFGWRTHNEYTDDAISNRTLKACTTLLTTVTPIY